jgi:metal-responsive CopG/Arc/MetJ family transcriptional regulator
MRVKTSVTLPKDLLTRMDAIERNRSAFIERATRAYLAEMERRRRNLRDLQILNTNARGLNTEAADVLEYQAFP